MEPYFQELDPKAVGVSARPRDPSNFHHLAAVRLLREPEIFLRTSLPFLTKPHRAAEGGVDRSGEVDHGPEGRLLQTICHQL